LNRWQQLAIAVWIVILLAITARCLFAPRANSVYPIFAGAARNWLAGVDLYRSGGDPYRYSPLVAALLVPFSFLPDQVGGIFWRLLNAVGYLGALAWWTRAVLPKPVTTSQQALLFLLVVPLSVGSLNNGQSNPLILALLLAACALVTTERWSLAAGCVALACLFKVYPIAIGLLLATIYPVRFAGRLCLALILGLVLPFLLQSPDYVWTQYRAWIHHLQHDDRQMLPLELWYRDFRLLCEVWGQPLSPQAYLTVQLIGAGMIAVICVAGRRVGWPQRRLLITSFALGCCWMTLFGSATESATYMLLAPTLAWAVVESWLDRQAWFVRAGLLASFGLFTVSQAAVWFPGAGKQIHALGVHPLAALLLWACLLINELSRLRKGPFLETSVFGPFSASAA
jgi:hypothetical protein